MGAEEFKKCERMKWGIEGWGNNDGARVAMVRHATLFAIQ